MANMLQQDTDQNGAMISSTTKTIKLDGKLVSDTELIYTRVAFLQQYRYTDITYVLCYELSPVGQPHYLTRVVPCVLSRRQS